MTRAQDLLLPDEDVRLRECAQEPIHVPGAVQPHGALVTVDPDRLTILQASENCANVLGVGARTLIGTGLGALVEPATESFVRVQLAAGAGAATTSTATQVDGRAFDVIVHHAGDVGVVEFEPTVEILTGRAYVSALDGVAHRLFRAADVTELRNVAAREMRELTGFDQVMIYHFHPDGHGEVMADDHAEGMTPYLGLHFPASDIPAQARRLYQLRGSGLVADSHCRPAALIPVGNPWTGTPTDLSRAELRSVSPHHLRFMHNMGQGASFTLSLMLDGRLVGLITCAHRGPRRLPFLLRRVCEVLAQQVALQLDAMTRTTALTHQLQARDVRARLIEQIKVGPDLAAGLTSLPVTLLDLLPADGATVSLHQRLTDVGVTPGSSATSALLAALTADDGTVTPVLTESLAKDWPALAELVPSVAGLFVLPFAGAGECLVWFRRELSQTLDWLGEQSVDNRATPLSPRTSFDSWRQTVTDRSAPWDERHVAEAAEFGRDIDQVLLRRAEAQMASMALHDSLTGLANRRLLVDRITSALKRAERHGVEVAILFCDLDDFKRVNDFAGHAAGDAVLVEAAARLTSVVRATDSVARIGGDEFVVVLEPVAEPAPAAPAPGDDRPAEPATEPASAPEAGPATARTAAARIAERISTELTRPIPYEGQEHEISVSVGITYAAPGSCAEDLLRDADAAMYRAKQTGKNRVATFDDSLRDSILDRASAEHALRSALSPAHHRPGPNAQHHPRVSVVYQPAVDLDRGLLVGFEARPRLTDAAGQPVPPTLFTTVAEQTGLSLALSDVVLDDALGALVAWRAANPDAAPVPVSVKIGPRRAQPADLLDWLRAGLARHGLHAADLALDLDESVLTEAGSATLRQLDNLRKSGLFVTIDDFGRSPTSLRRLATLPVDAVKLDPSFTAALPDDEISATIVRAAAGLAAELGLACALTGLDTAPQLRGLPAGVIGHGALFGAPTTAPSFPYRAGGGNAAGASASDAMRDTEISFSGAGNP